MNAEPGMQKWWCFKNIQTTPFPTVASQMIGAMYCAPFKNACSWCENESGCFGYLKLNHKFAESCWLLLLKYISREAIVRLWERYHKNNFTFEGCYRGKRVNKMKITSQITQKLIEYSAHKSYKASQPTRHRWRQNGNVLDYDRQHVIM